MRGDVGRNLLLEGDGKHPPGTLTDQLVEVDDELGAALLPHYTQHRGVPSSSAVARRRPQLVGQAGRYAALSSKKPIHNFR
jgi:hypothetical protein